MFRALSFLSVKSSLDEWRSKERSPRTSWLLMRTDWLIELYHERIVRREDRRGNRSQGKRQTIQNSDRIDRKRPTRRQWWMSLSFSPASSSFLWVRLSVSFTDDSSPKDRGSLPFVAPEKRRNGKNVFRFTDGLFVSHRWKRGEKNDLTTRKKNSR